MISLALEAITSFSVVPLRLIAFLGFMVFLGLWCKCVGVVRTIFERGSSARMDINRAAGLLLGGIQIFCIGMLGEYLGKIYAEIKRRPRYIIETMASGTADYEDVPKYRLSRNLRRSCPPSLARVEHIQSSRVILMGVTIGFRATDLCERARSLEETDTRYFWLRLLGIVSLSAALRLVFFQGMHGGDDLIYFMRASEIAHNIWNSSDYIGALRYGTNIPIAGAIALFGPSLYSGALIPLICSLRRDYCCRCHHEIGLGSANCTLRRFSAVLGSVADQQCHQHSCGSNSGLHHHDHVCALLGRRA